MSKASGAYTLTVGVGELIGPFVGQALYGWIGYKWTTTAMSGIVLVSCGSFIIWGGVFERHPAVRRQLQLEEPNEEE